MKQLTFNRKYRLTNNLGTYVVEPLEQVETAMWGPCLIARFECFGATDEGLFRLDQIESMEPLIELEAA